MGYIRGDTMDVNNQNQLLWAVQSKMIGAGLNPNTYTDPSAKKLGDMGYRVGGLGDIGLNCDNNQNNLLLLEEDEHETNAVR